MESQDENQKFNTIAKDCFNYLYELSNNHLKGNYQNVETTINFLQ